LNRHEQRDKVKAMPARYRDALHQGSLGLSHEAFDSRLMLFGPDFNQALRELDRCLTLMRKRGYQEAIQGVPLKTIRFHLVAWYIDVDYVQVPIYTRKATKRGWVNTPSGFHLEVRRHRDAREQKAELGVQWIADHFNWDNVHLKAIHAACGDLIAA
jgi:hypothetical protein